MDLDKKECNEFLAHQFKLIAPLAIMLLMDYRRKLELDDADPLAIEKMENANLVIAALRRGV